MLSSTLRVVYRKGRRASKRCVTTRSVVTREKVGNLPPRKVAKPQAASRQVVFRGPTALRQLRTDIHERVDVRQCPEAPNEAGAFQPPVGPRLFCARVPFLIEGEADFLHTAV